MCVIFPHLPRLLYEIGEDFQILGYVSSHLLLCIYFCQYRNYPEEVETEIGQVPEKELPVLHFFPIYQQSGQKE